MAQLESAAIDIVGLSKRFGGQIAVEALNLSVAPGEIVCLLGANGAGKTTTLNLLLGFVEPDAGHVRVAGYAAGSREARRAIGYVPEAVALYPKLTGVENLAFFAQLHGERPSRNQLLDALAGVGLDAGAADRRAETYSKGMRQKVGLAAATLTGAQVLLLDEPLSGLDPDAADQFGELLRATAGRGAAVLMATHDIFRARLIAARIGIMRGGQLVEMVRADQLEALELERLYLGHMRRAA